jgi:hypothetical protein
MGYDVLRVRNEEIQTTPDAVAERIIQRYFEGADNNDRRPTKITNLNKLADYDPPIPKEVNFNLQLWAVIISNRDGRMPYPLGGSQLQLQQMSNMPSN